MNWVAASLIAAGVAVGVGALAALHILPTGLSPLSNPVSQYGISDYKLGYRIQTIAYGVAGVGAAIGVTTLPGASALVVVLCSLFAAARLAISWFPMDAPGAAPTATGRRHGILGITAFISVGLAATQLSRALNHHHADGTFAGTSGVLALVILVGLLAMTLERRLGARLFGLAERLSYLAMTAWLVLLAVVLASR